MLTSLVRLARPAHWVKNGFVLMPVPFAMVAGARVEPAVLLLGLLGFSLVNSAVYAFNDVLDAAADRLHPRKKLRPVASGAVPPGVAMGFSGGLALGGLGLLGATSLRGAVLLTLVYVGVNLAYSLGAKTRALLDVFLLSSGFVIRVALGCVLVGVIPSNWLLLCSSALALFLGFAKRRADLYEGIAVEHRPSLAGYTMGFLDHGMTIAACVALVSYALYSMESEILLPGREMASMPFVVYGVLFYLRLAHLKGSGGSPVDLALRSRTMWACLIGWFGAVLWSLGLW
jgi:4-hydroxybenzoate polyprenyltransferase